ncbi:ATP-binding protein [Polaromonas sp.]|uniref:ATP-binding protein n=1 Tax=Polaromonas sp. TaxID=1869339 RepID=UPI003BB5A0B9
MALESWLPIGFILPDGGICRKPRHGAVDWQIVETGGGGTALVVAKSLHDQWLSTGLVDASSFQHFTFGADELFEFSCGPSEWIAPVNSSNSPNTRNEALGFATALKATREIDTDSPLQDSIYVERLGRILPTYSLSARAADDVILGYWLTGGAQVSAKSFRRLYQMTNWLGSSGLKDVVSAAGMGQLAKDMLAEGADTDHAESKIKSQDASPQDADSEAAGLERGIPFTLAGRPLLEDFFNEHVIDIVRNKERYAALGIGFPSAVVLHGPPGCGKTFAVEQLVNYLGWPSFQVDASSVASPYIHETSKKVAEVFTKAMNNSPSVLVIDEMEAFLADRDSGGGGSNHRVEEVAEFLRRIPEATKSEVLVIAMTNKVEMIDAAIMRRGRFDHIIEVPPATEVEVKALLDKLLTKLPTDGLIDTSPLAKRLACRPLSDVAFVVREGARLCARSGASKIQQVFLVDALDSTPARDGQGASRSIGFL